MTKLDRFNGYSIRVIESALDESKRLGHDYVGSEQLLVGLLKTDNNAARLLNKSGITLSSARKEVEKLIGRGSGLVDVEPTFTPSAKRVIESANTFARDGGHSVVKPEHILLAIFNSDESILLQVFLNLGVHLSQISDMLSTLIADLFQLQLKQLRTSRSAPTPESTKPRQNRKAPKQLHITTLPQEPGRFVTEVRDSSILDESSFRAVGYGDNKFEAIASALESLARLYRDYQQS